MGDGEGAFDVGCVTKFCGRGRKSVSENGLKGFWEARSSEVVGEEVIGKLSVGVGEEKWAEGKVEGGRLERREVGTEEGRGGYKPFSITAIFFLWWARRM